MKTQKIKKLRKISRALTPDVGYSTLRKFILWKYRKKSLKKFYRDFEKFTSRTYSNKVVNLKDIK